MRIKRIVAGVIALALFLFFAHLMRERPKIYTIEGAGDAYVRTIEGKVRKLDSPEGKNILSNRDAVHVPTDFSDANLDALGIREYLVEKKYPSLRKN